MDDVRGCNKCRYTAQLQQSKTNKDIVYKTEEFLKSNANIQTKEEGPDRYVSNNWVSSVK